MEIKIGAEPDPQTFLDRRPELSPKLQDREGWRLLYRHKRNAYVTEGYFICRRLRYNSQYKPLPDYSSAITSLTAGPDGTLYGATSGERVHVFVFNPAPPFDTVAPLAALEGETDCRRCLVWEKENSVVCATRAAPGAKRADWEGGALYRVTGVGFYADAVQEWPRGLGEVEKLCVPVKGEGLAALVIDRGRSRVYGLSDKTAEFYFYDLERKCIERRGSLDPTWLHSENLMITPDGTVFGTAVGNRLMRYDPQADKLEMLEQTIPTWPGRALYARIDSWVYEPLSGLLYIGDQGDGFLWTLDPRTLETRLLGKPTDRIRIRALAAAHDGRIFGMAGQVGDMCQMFVYEPQTRQLRNLGVPQATVEERRYGFEFDSAAAGPQGQIYFGESERSSRLFIYFPSYPAAGVGEVQAPQ